MVSTTEGDQAMLAWAIRREPASERMVRVTNASGDASAETIAFDTAVELWTDDFAATLTRGCTVTITDWSVLTGNAARCAAAARGQLTSLVIARLLSPDNIITA